MQRPHQEIMTKYSHELFAFGKSRATANAPLTRRGAEKKDEKVILIGSASLDAGKANSSIEL